MDGQSLRIAAVLTDPDGVDDLIGGTLSAPGSDAVYGSFQTSATEGSYELSLTWTEIAIVSPFDADVGEIASREFRATFFDVAGHSASRDFIVEFACSDDQEFVCEDSCISSFEDDHCGSCSNECTSESWMLDGIAWCAADGGPRCAGRFLDETRGSCNEACGTIEGDCVIQSQSDSGLRALYLSGDGSVYELYLDSCAAVAPMTHPNVGWADFWRMSCVCAT